MNVKRIKAHSKYCEVGDVDALPVYLDGIKLDIHELKEPDYVMMLMTTYGNLEQVSENNKITYHEKESKIQKHSIIQK